MIPGPIRRSVNRFARSKTLSPCTHRCPCLLPRAAPDLRQVPKPGASRPGCYARCVRAAGINDCQNSKYTAHRVGHLCARCLKFHRSFEVGDPSREFDKGPNALGAARCIRVHPCASVVPFSCFARAARRFVTWHGTGSSRREPASNLNRRCKQIHADKVQGNSVTAVVSAGVMACAGRRHITENDESFLVDLPVLPSAL